MPVPVPEATFTASTATGSTTVFPYGFMIASEDDLGVMLDGVLQTSGYTVSGVGNPEGGDVTFSVAPANGVRVVRFLNPVLNRETNYQQFGDFNNSTVNLDFDRLWLAMQFLNQNTSRSLKLPVDTADNQEITQTPAQRANKGLRFDDDGNLTLSVFDPDAAQESAQDAVLDAQAAAAAAAAAVEAFGEGGILALEYGGTNADTAAGARANLGLGDAATKTAGTGAGHVLLLAEANKLPALDGSLLNDLPIPAENPVIRQVVWFETGAYASGSTAIPSDDTIPQNTEGTQFMTATITPTAADSILEIEVLANLDNQSGTYGMIGALFKDSGANAIAVGRTNSYFSSGAQLLIKHRVVAGSTSAQEFKFRAGTPSVIVVALNGYTSRLMGGEMNSYIKITEYRP